MNAATQNNLTPIALKCHDLYDFLAKFSKEINVEVKNECDETSIIISEDFGNGEINLHRFDNGVLMLEFKSILNADLQLDMSNTNDPFCFIYNLSSKIDYKIGAFKNDSLKESEMLISSNKNPNTLSLFIEANQMINFTMIIIDRPEFIKESACYLESTDTTLRNFFKTKKGELMYHHKKNIDLNIVSTFYKNAFTDFIGLARRVHIEAKMNEILSFELKNFQVSGKTNEPTLKLRPSEIEKVKLAAILLQENLNNPKTVEDLAKQVGLNISKLQYGFKSIFNLTVNNYLKKVRLEFAKEQLILGELNVSQIINELGLVNKSYFTRMFKEAFGVSPKAYAKSQKITE